ncbi:MAG: hypothetical protein ABJF10_23155 [Chthoniobacter sp.]|uniref:hypothetical protein n=1 Tax=Chthoniobacter sp. TaxID=2510640 RepID=UPI0032AA9134
MRKILYSLAALLLAEWAVLHAADVPPSVTKPSIVFIFADDWGWGDLSCHGHPWLTDDAKRVELHRLTEDRAEANDVAKEHPDIVARLSKLALDWKATLPTKPNPECLTTEPVTEKPAAPKSAPKGVTPEARAKAFDRWDTNHDGFLTLDEYKAGLKGQENVEQRFKGIDGAQPKDLFPWHFNVCRQRVRGTTIERTAYSATGKDDFYVPEKFAKLWGKGK